MCAYCCIIVALEDMIEESLTKPVVEDAKDPNK